jgi:hypothetical protein
VVGSRNIVDQLDYSILRESFGFTWRLENLGAVAHRVEKKLRFCCRGLSARSTQKRFIRFRDRTFVYAFDAHGFRHFEMP